MNEEVNYENLPSDQTDPSGSNGDGLKGQFWLLCLELSGLILFSWLFATISWLTLGSFGLQTSLIFLLSILNHQPKLGQPPAQLCFIPGSVLGSTLMSHTIVMGSTWCSSLIQTGSGPSPASAKTLLATTLCQWWTAFVMHTVLPVELAFYRWWPYFWPYIGEFTATITEWWPLHLLNYLR